LLRAINLFVVSNYHVRSPSGWFYLKIQIMKVIKFCYWRSLRLCSIISLLLSQEKWLSKEFENSWINLFEVVAMGRILQLFDNFYRYDFCMKF
jgi:hypothetical protein